VSEKDSAYDPNTAKRTAIPKIAKLETNELSRPEKTPLTVRDGVYWTKAEKNELLAISEELDLSKIDVKRYCVAISDLSKGKYTLRKLHNYFSKILLKDRTKQPMDEIERKLFEFHARVSGRKKTLIQAKDKKKTFNANPINRSSLRVNR